MLQPCQEVLARYGEEVRTARAGQGLLLYVPTNAPLLLHGDWSGCTATAWDLESGRRTPVALHAADGQTQLEMHPFYGDALLELREKA